MEERRVFGSGEVAVFNAPSRELSRRHERSGRGRRSRARGYPSGRGDICWRRYWSRSSTSRWRTSTSLLGEDGLSGEVGDDGIATLPLDFVIGRDAGLGKDAVEAQAFGLPGGAGSRGGSVSVIGECGRAVGGILAWSGLGHACSSSGGGLRIGMPEIPVADC